MLVRPISTFGKQYTFSRISKRRHGPAFWIVSIVIQIVLGILASAIVMWFSRYREYRADEGGAKLSGRNNMIAALQRLQSYTDALLYTTKWQPWQSVQVRSAKCLPAPPLEERIKHLQNM